MTRYRFSAEGTISLSLVVEAESLKTAKQLAGDAAMQGLCHQCAEGCGGEWSTSGELDCEPRNIRFDGIDDDTPPEAK